MVDPSGSSFKPYISYTLDDSDPPPIHWNLDQIVSDLRVSREVTHNIRHHGRIRRTPSRDVLAGILDALSAVLFPSHYSDLEIGSENIDYFVGHILSNVLLRLAEQVQFSLAFTQVDDVSEAELNKRALKITRDFAASLPALRGVLVSDLRAALNGDPAATNFPEILLGYPGMMAIIYHRPAHTLYGLGASLLGRVTIGHGSSIGGNVWLTRPVPPGSQVRQQQPSIDIELSDPFD